MKSNQLTGTIPNLFKSWKSIVYGLTAQGGSLRGCKVLSGS